MSHTVCPGAKFLRQPKPEIFKCPECTRDVEIWSDELSGKCPSCGTVVLRDSMMSCLQWCAMARECVGDKAYDSFNEKRAESIKDRLLNLAADSEGNIEADTQTIERSIYFAEKLAMEENADLHVALAGSALSVLFKGRLDLARKELLKLGYQLEDVEEVCRIIETADTDADDSVNRAVVHDALLLVRKEASGPPTGEKQRFMTAAGAKYAG